MADLGNLNFGVHLKDYTEQEYEAIKKKLVNMHVTTSAKVGLKVDIKEIEDKVEALLKNKTYKVKLDVDSESIKKLKEAFKGHGVDASELRAMRGVSQIIRADAYVNSQKALEQLRIARMQAAKASDTHNAAMKRTNTTMSSQSRIAGELKNQIANVYSIYTLERFVRGLYTIGGEFQKQRIALTSILGDSMKAETIFNRIKDLAVVSPFQFKELASYAKQLSAYSIPYEELYDTTKRLADISAGVGVDMGRIILAYGQVRSAAFLRGQELRQFTEAGIPLVDELAKRLTKLTGVATSAGDVFDKISRKEVSFGMVKDVLWDLTNEGGKFYNMQEALAESLAGKWSNLQDAWDVMMADIAESNSGVLSDSLEILTKLMKHWEDFAKVFIPIITSYGTYKTVALLASSVNLKLIKTFISLTASVRSLKDAIALLGLVTKANPLGLLLGALSGIIALFYAFREETKTTTEVITDLNKAISDTNDKMQGNKAVDSLIDRYETLSKKANKSAEESRELGRITKNLANTFTDAVTQTDKYGVAISLSVEKMRKLSQEQKDLYKKQFIGTMANAQIQKQSIDSERERLAGIIREGGYRRFDENGRELSFAKYKPEDITKARNRLLELEKQSLDLANIIDTARQSYHSMNKIDISKPLADWEKEANKLAGDMDAIKPKEGTSYEEYMEMLSGNISDLEKKTKAFASGNKYSEKQLASYNKELEATRKIYKALGGLEKLSGSEKDPIAEQWKDRSDLIDKAVSSYEKWRKIEGDEAATQRVKGISEFSSVFDEKGVNLDLNNPSKAYKYIQGQLDRSKEKQEDLYISLGVKIDKAGIDSAKQEVDNALKEIERYISESGKKWDLYKQLFDITGSREQSMSIAFGGEIGFDSLIDELKAKLRKKTGAYSDMPVDIVLGLDEKAIREKFGKSANEILSLQKEINDKIQEKNDFSLIDEQKTIMEFASIEKKIEAVKGKYQELIDSATTQEGKEAYTQKMNKEIQELNDESIKLLPLWQKLFGDTTNMGYNNLRRLVNEAKKFSESAIEQKDPITGKSQFELTDNDNKKHILSLEEYLRLLKQIEKTQNELNSQNPFQGVIDGFQKLKAAEGEEEKQDALKVIGSNANAAAQMIQGVTEAWANMFSAFGNDDLADTLGLVGELTGELGSLVEGLTSGNPIQMASSALSFIPNIIGSIAKAHDKKLDRAIEKSKLRAQELQNVYDAIERSLEHFLGSGTEMKLVDAEKDRSELIQLNSQIEAIRKKDKLNIFDEVALSRYSKEAEKLNKRVSAYDEGGAYGYQRALMEEQISELEKQKQAELDKKDVDQSKVADYEAQIAEMQQQVKDFAEETAETLYGIDLKGWASELGDALYEAWQKGENGAEAFRNKVADIMGSVMNSVLKIGVLEPAMKQLQAMLFGEDGMSGYFGKDFSLDSKEVKGIADYLMSLDKKTDAYYSALDEVDAYMKKRYGVSLKESEKNSSSLSKGIQENITEETANILASYINGIRADVSIKRTLQERFFKEDFPKMNVIAEAQLRQLSMITENTRRTADSNEAILNEVSELRNEIHSAKLTKDKGFYFR